ncbi:hypothetical protein COJ07_28585 [Bacillus cereus]|uniref:hypothetical protein n=1 Tax=Bacillus cereus TaxID=1396 RepID=UPI000BF44D19|nr:hypothetical protein [Bacillus cereus]PFL14044.1 hypothetical protein COJ07_28585 [Bacillus cereus]
MGRLKIEKIFYEGDNYYFESPKFKDGINIIEGENGSGKSTLSNLISFSLGNYVKEFDKKESKTHTQVVNDTNNYVIAIISINEEKFILKRFFNDNRIFIEEDGEIQEYLIHRPQSDVIIFSDWLLNKLGISVAEFYQGTAKSKLNFADLFRLIYYDQKTIPEKIYKDSRNDRNFISDSGFMRKVIFQMLMGHEFSEYYQLVGKINKEKRNRNNLKIKKEGFLEIAGEFGFGDLNDESLGELEQKIQQVEIQLHRLKSYEEEISEKKNDSSPIVEEVRQFKKQLMDVELLIEDKLNRIHRLYREIKNIKTLKENTILEVTQIKKIILTHKELSLFSPDTCPYCLNKVERDKDHCICGKEVIESEYERFFYSSDEYLLILKSRQKSIETLDLAIQSCDGELKELERKLNDLKTKKNNINKLIAAGKEDVIRNTNLAQIEDIQQKKYALKEKLVLLKQKHKVKKSFDEIKQKLALIEEIIGQINRNLKNKERDAKEEIAEQVRKFNNIYTSLLRDIKADIKTARIDEENYMPIINDGEYKEASVDVIIRLMYFLTLLKMSINDSEIPFPRFLLIDTPENLGIDKDNLEKSLAKFTTVNGELEQKNYQIILTTGLNKYPEEFSVFKRGRSLYRSQRLLSKKQ